MTACVNKKHTRRVALAISASLVGALSLGAAPAAAFANDGASTLAVADEHEAFLNGTVSEFKVGNSTKTGTDAGEIKVSDLAKSEIVITSVTPDGAGADPIAPATGGNTFYYKRASKGDTGAIQINGKYWTAAGRAGTGQFSGLTPGEYIAVSTYDGTDGFTGDGNVAPAVSFKVVADSLDGAKLMLDLGNGVYTDSLTYDDSIKWSDADFSVVLDGEDISSDVTVEVFNKDDDKDNLYGVSADPVQAGSYKVVITGTGIYAGDEEQHELTVAKLDLSKIELYLDDVAMGQSAPTYTDIKGDGLAKIGSAYVNSTYFDFDIVGNTWGSDKAGEYTYELTVKADSKAAANVTGTATLKFNRVNADAKTVSWSYDGRGFNNGGSIIVDRSLEADDFNSAPWKFKNFDPSKLVGTFVDADGNPVTLGEGEWTYTVRNSKGEVVSDMSKKDVYSVSAEAVSSAFDYNVKRSTITFTVTVLNGTIGTADTVFTYDGEVKDSVTVEYDTSDVLDKLGVQVRCDGKVLSEGTDYDVVVLNSKGEEVDSIVDAGTYYVRVVSDYYAFDNSSSTDYDELVVTVKQRNLDNTDVLVNNDAIVELGGKKYIAYTGEEIEGFTFSWELKDADGKVVKTVTIPAEEYELVNYLYNSGTGNSKEVSDVKEIGDYQFNLVDVKGGNYTFNSLDNNKLTTSDKVNVTSKKVAFSDVSLDAWYAGSVYDAKALGYVKGVSGTSYFMPDNAISRADATIIIARMAGADSVVNGMTEDQFDKDYGFYTDAYSDVADGKYYTRAIAWATKAGIVHGDANADTFRPEDTVTREEFAAMLYNYAQFLGNDASVEGDLSGVNGADTVSPWMVEAVTWAYEHGVMGNNGASLDGQGDITRAQTAAMAVNYQPEELDVPVIQAP